MEQKLDIPKSETELRSLLDTMYQKVKQAKDDGKKPKFLGLLEIIVSEASILTAVHNIQSNKGSNTSGSDGQTIRDILDSDYSMIIKMVQHALQDYRPKPVRRVYIPKPGKMEKRPLGIPAILDRLIQECVRIVIEPICEARFFPHSYGFRPMRSADMALERLVNIVHVTGYHWAVEGDISKYFDTINHTILIKQLWNLGICDRRVLMVIKRMLKAGIMCEIAANPMGTQQGAIISPLLANVYLNSFDWWISKQWATKKTQTQYFNDSTRIRALKKSRLLPAYLIRYADNWVLITDSCEHAEKWKELISKYMCKKLKLQLSVEKTVITDIRKQPIHFLGFEFKEISGKSKTGFLSKTQPDRARLKEKVKELRKEIRDLRRCPELDLLVHRINLINAKIRGLLEYYKGTTNVFGAMHKYADALKVTGYCSLRRKGGRWMPAKSVDNLLSVHKGRNTQIPAIEYDGMKIGLTSLGFVNWKKTRLKTQEETPYSTSGRTLYALRTGKEPLLARADQLLNLSTSRYIGKRMKSGKYTFEFILNRAYAYNRDRGKCRVCGMEVNPYDVETHHIDPSLPKDLLHKVGNLATTHESCHKIAHNNEDLSRLSKKVAEKVKWFRDKLR